jgi:ABC-type antimicrobial peptide transport system permease subunit
LLDNLLFGVAAHDPLSYATAAAVLLTVAVFASLLPALRAARIHPIQALRHE